MYGWILSIESSIVFSCQQTLSCTNDKVLGYVIKETIKIFGIILRTKYIAQKSRPRVNREEGVAMGELEKAENIVDEACAEKIRMYEYRK